ncbi:hypothetical protein BJ546DRAFT_518128 [Cryomyces antarcticus]
MAEVCWLTFNRRRQPLGQQASRPLVRIRSRYILLYSTAAKHTQHIPQCLLSTFLLPEYFTCCAANGSRSPQASIGKLRCLCSGNVFTEPSATQLRSSFQFVGRQPEDFCPRSRELRLAAGQPRQRHAARPQTFLQAFVWTLGQDTDAGSYQRHKHAACRTLLSRTIELLRRQRFHIGATLISRACSCSPIRKMQVCLAAKCRRANQAATVPLRQLLKSANPWPLSSFEARGSR